jgi:hypothetical protein
MVLLTASEATNAINNDMELISVYENILHFKNSPLVRFSDVGYPII